MFLNRNQWLERICHLEILLIYSSGSQLVWRSKVINLNAILLESIMRNISAKLICICTSAEFRLSFQFVEILTLVQASYAEMYSFIMILNSNMIFWTPILEYLKTFSLPNSTLSLSQPDTARWKTNSNLRRMYVNRNCNISPKCSRFLQSRHSQSSKTLFNFKMLFLRYTFTTGRAH